MGRFGSGSFLVKKRSGPVWDVLDTTTDWSLVDAEDLVAGPVTGHDLDASRWDSEVLRDQLAHRRVRLVVDWRGSRPHQQPSASLPTDLVAFGSRNHPHLEQRRQVIGHAATVGRALCVQRGDLRAAGWRRQ